MADVPIVEGAEGEFPGNCSVSYLSLAMVALKDLIGYGSTEGACRRSLTAEKILYTGRQTCCLYLVLWLCGIYTIWLHRFSHISCCHRRKFNAFELEKNIFYKTIFHFLFQINTIIIWKFTKTEYKHFHQRCIRN